MATTAPPGGKINFPNMLGTKRRRMRSGGNVSTATNNTPKASTDDIKDEKTAETSRCKGATTIPIFLKKTYKMIDTCDPTIASWTPDGEMFVVKNPELFAQTIIPQYFDHNKFSSFARQLNFYGFRKMQAKPIRNADFDAETAKHVTFYNEKFKRGRCDLLKEIQRSTRGGGTHTNQDHQREVESLKNQISALEAKMEDMNQQMEDRLRRLELDMLGRMEQMMLAMQQSQHTQLQLQQQQQQPGTSGTSGIASPAVDENTNGVDDSIKDEDIDMQPPRPEQAWDPLPLDRAKTSNSAAAYNPSPALVSTDSLPPQNPNVNPPATLPPHPKQKQLPLQGLPNALTLPPSRLNSLRGISRGVSRGVSAESSASAVLLWEDKFFSMLMLGENEAQAAAQAAEGIDPNDPSQDVGVDASGPIPSVVKPGHDILGRPNFMQDASDRTLSSVSTHEAI